MAHAWMAEDKAPALLGQGLSFLGMRERRGKEVSEWPGLNCDVQSWHDRGDSGPRVGVLLPLNQPLSGIGRGLRSSEPPQDGAGHCS